ncbi:MAG: cell division protein FtsL [bacterium]|nr:septum formation initiator family protein [Candidatus Margulisiibacteriota bacterium]
MPRSHKYKFRRAILILIIFVILAGIHLAINTQNIDLKYNLTDLRAKSTKLQANNRSLAIEVARLEDLHSIEKLATEKFNMLYPSEINYLIKGSAVSENNPKTKTP